MPAPTITIDITVGSTGAIPTPPQTISDNLVAYLVATVPGYTSLPGLLIEDILSTEIAGIVLIDQAAVDAINSVTANNANPWLLNLLGQMAGVPQGQDTNTAVYVQFSGDAGYFIPAGFLVSDGTYTYSIQDGGSIASDGQSALLYAIATQPGSWAVPANTVTSLSTSVPSPYTLSVTNPGPGVASAGPQTTADYQAQVMLAGLASAQGAQRFLKTQLYAVAGVQQRLVSAVQINGGGWEVIVGGGDPYQVAGAIYAGILDISSLVGSTIAITGITNANPGVVTTNLNHGLVTGQANVDIAGVVGMTGVNGGPYTVTVLSPTTFSFGVDTTSSGAWVSGGVVTPNSRNLTVDLIDPPNVYSVPIVLPPAQTVTVQLTWNSNAPNAVSPAAVAQAGAPAIAAYINSIDVGPNPINEFELDAVFQAAIANIIATPYLDRLVWTVSIDGVEVSPVSGTGAIYGDPESYFTCQAAAVTITQG